MYRWSRLGLSAFAFCIALMQFAMPVITYARMAQESRLVQTICSPSGASKRVFVEADGTFDLVVVDNTTAPDIPAGGTMEALA